MNDESSEVFLDSRYLILSNMQDPEKKKSSKFSFLALKMLQRIQTLFLLFCRSLVIDKLLVMHSMLGPAISHASAEFRNKELVHKMWNQRSGLRGIMVHYFCEIRVFHQKIYIVTGKGLPCFLILSLFIVCIARSAMLDHTAEVTWENSLHLALELTLFATAKETFAIRVSCVQERLSCCSSKILGSPNKCEKHSL